MHPKEDGKIKNCDQLQEAQQQHGQGRDPIPWPRIRMDVTRARYRSKIDLSNAYEQVCVEPEDVRKTAFLTIFGTFLSQVMQQGDCNAPATFQKLMTVVLWEYIGQFVHVYFNDIFVFSNMLKEHERHLWLVLDALTKAEFYLEREKCNLYAEKLDCLGHMIDECGVHADTDKMARICEWRKPRSLNKVQQFVGLVEYLAKFMPDVSAYTTPLTGSRTKQVWYSEHGR